MPDEQKQKTKNPKFEYESWGYLTGDMLKKQKDVKPNVEDVAGEFINEDKFVNLKNLLGFLRENKLNPRWASGNSWSVKYKNKNVCYIKIIRASWYVFHSNFTRENWFVEYDDYFADDGLKEFVQKNITGGHCPNNCKGRTKTIFGKDLADICTCWPYRLENPDGAALENAKKVILAIKNFIADSSAGKKSMVKPARG